MKTTNEIRNWLERRKGEKLQVEKQVVKTRTELKELKRELHTYEQAREIIRKVSLKTQQKLQVHISDVASLAMDAIFEDPYKLQVDFVQRRNKTECDITFVRGDKQPIKPMDATGGGAVDVAAFALRISSWTMNRPRTSNTILLDEPMRFLSRDLQERASQMIKELSTKLGVQFIIITHEPTLATYADREFKVTQQNGVSKVNYSRTVEG